MNKQLIANEIKLRVKMPEMLARYGVDVGRHKRIVCPLHNGTDKNCGVKDDYIHCFVCGEATDQIGFVQRYFELNFTEAVEKINVDFSLGLPIGEKIDKRKNLEIARKSFEIKRAQKKKQEEKERLVSAWLNGHDELIRLEKQMVAFKPNFDDSILHPKFLEAIKNIEYAKYMLNCAEEDLYLYEQSNN